MRLSISIYAHRLKPKKPSHVVMYDAVKRHATVGAGFSGTRKCTGSIWWPLGEARSPPHILKTPGVVLGRGQDFEMELLAIGRQT